MSYETKHEVGESVVSIRTPPSEYNGLVQVVYVWPAGWWRQCDDGTMRGRVWSACWGFSPCVFFVLAITTSAEHMCNHVHPTPDEVGAKFVSSGVWVVSDNIDFCKGVPR
ncbi:hypothetical protein Pmani_013214 [Petrolisthes manimaculis]|uniref:Uncharacterized protein n=1 Tax=Petrolisthes manimaculis TaxID=1843537 RepID=A0AAE1U9J7_9EUCA|nr:hypothetical protein Pmani_013214 [Petrolisthes manimaculis]